MEDPVTDCDCELDLLTEPSLRNILDQDSLRWIFISGKGGVGKTTVSCSLASQLSRCRERVLLVSTDPAHSISDAFDQPFSAEPTLVRGFQNLFAMEIKADFKSDDMGIFNEQVRGLFSELLGGLPGIDEALSFAQMMSEVQTMGYSTVIFDTAPTGHTLRLLSFPQTTLAGLTKMLQMRGLFGGIFNSVGSLLTRQSMSDVDVFGKLEKLKAQTEQVVEAFRSPDVTTFICVCIPEFLSLYETERMIQELANFGIDIHNVVVNQIVVPHPESSCRLCRARRRMQDKYLAKIAELYDVFNVTKLPLLEEEVRGSEAIQRFGENLMVPFPIDFDLPARTETSAAAASPTASAHTAPPPSPAPAPSATIDSSTDAGADAGTSAASPAPADSTE